jgi:hypothetical protein
MDAMRPFSRNGAAAILVVLAACTGSGAEGVAKTSQPVPHVTTVAPGAPRVVGGKEGLPAPLEVPAGWSYVTADPGPHFAGFVAATNPGALEGVRDGSKFGPVTGRGLEPDDAFVEVQILWPPPFDGGKPRPTLPRNLGPEHFTPGERFLGRASRAYTARGRDDGIYSIRYWIGPDADAATAAAAVELATSVRS